MRFPKYQWMIGLALILACIGIVIITIHSFEIKKAIYIVPNNFHGHAIIKMNQSNGINLPIRNGVVRVQFPPNGILELKGDDPMKTFSEKVAQWESGLPLPFTDEYANPSAIRLNHIGYYHGQKESWYFVGTGDEAEAYLISVESQMK